MMTAWDRLFSYFPLLMTAAVIASSGLFAQWPNAFTAILSLFVIYLLPPMVLRIMLRWAPLKTGIALIDGKTFSPWLAAHHIQQFYDALPFLESLLRVIPGFYSTWLRMWGSRVGYGVTWPVRIDVLDRNLMDVGNRVTFDREVELAAHVRQKLEGGGSRVLVRQVRIGGHAYVGAGVRIGPGAIVPHNANVPALTVVRVNETYGEAVRHPEKDEAQFALS
jgi:acetyltransferase-like isoleucine patch superfamily enzyme